MKQARQGDLLIKRIETIPEDATNTSGKILALGESTGHKHQTLLHEVKHRGNDLTMQYIEVVDPNEKIVHEEHSEINLPPGNYSVTRQREWDYPAQIENTLRAQESARAFRTVWD